MSKSVQYTKVKGKFQHQDMLSQVHIYFYSKNSIAKTFPLNFCGYHYEHSQGRTSESEASDYLRLASSKRQSRLST